MNQILHASCRRRGVAPSPKSARPNGAGATPRRLLLLGLALLLAVTARAALEPVLTDLNVTTAGVVSLELTYSNGLRGTVWEIYRFDGGGTPGDTFNGRNRMWDAADTNLLLPGSGNAVTWTDPLVFTGLLSRMYAFGYSQADVDGDGISDGMEAFVVKTLVDGEDTDGDGLPDGWEYANGLNPLSGMNSNLMAWWSMDEGAGTTVVNRAGTNWNGRCVHMAGTNWVPGVYGGALWFDGVDDQVTVTQQTAIVTGGCFTISAWVRCDEDAAAEFPTILADMEVCDWNYKGYWLGLELGTWGLSSTLGTCSNYGYIVVGGFTNPVWRHVALAYDGTNQYLYLDGQLVWADATPFAAARQGELLLGWAVDPYYTYRLKGALDDVRVYTYAMDGEEVGTFSEPFQDPDGDGLNNLQEYGAGTNPNNADTDGDGMPDGWDVQKGFSPVDFDDGQEDDDGDLLTNTGEYLAGTDPFDSDTDDDLLPDGWEVRYYSHPLVAASWEYISTSLSDLDQDGLTMLDEATENTCPYETGFDMLRWVLISNGADTDNDGMPDGWERDGGIKGYSPEGADGADGDPDNDGVRNLDEFLGQTHPLVKNDADMDSLPDKWEQQHNLSIATGAGVDGPEGDPDADGLNNLQEYHLGGDPHDVDTDNDTLPDAWEAQYGLKVWSAADRLADPDGDSVINYLEYVAGTNPRVSNQQGGGQPWQPPEDNKTASIHFFSGGVPVYLVDYLAAMASIPETPLHDPAPYAHLDSMTMVSPKDAERGRSGDGTYEADASEGHRNGQKNYATIWRSAPNKLRIYQDSYQPQDVPITQPSWRGCYLDFYRARIVGTPQVIGHEGLSSTAYNIVVTNGPSGPRSRFTWQPYMDAVGTGGWVRIEVEWEPLLKVELADDGANTKFGFDDKTTPSKPWVCVEKFDSTKIKATVDPASVVDQVYFAQGDFDGDKFDFSPAQPTASPQSVTIAGPGSEPIGWSRAEGAFFARAGCAASSCPAYDEMGVFVGKNTQPRTRYFTVTHINSPVTIPSPVPGDPNAEISSRWWQAAITPRQQGSLIPVSSTYDTPPVGDGNGRLNFSGPEINILLYEAAQAAGLTSRGDEPDVIWVFFVGDVLCDPNGQEVAAYGFTSGLDCFVGTGSRPVTRVAQTLAHEWGHALGCGHVNTYQPGDNLMHGPLVSVSDFLSFWSWQEVNR